MMKRLLLLFCLPVSMLTQTWAQGNIAINETNFPDAIFRDYLLAQDYGADAILTPEEIMGITEINVYGKDVSSLKGIEHFSYLQILSCSYNKLTSLDVSKNTYLNTIYCDGNSLTSLDVSKNPMLENLYANDNKLTSLDVSKNPKLINVYCQSNLIKSAAMTALINSLPVIETGYFLVLNRDNKSEGNEISYDQIEEARKKGWTVQIFENWDWVAYAGYSTTIDINETNFPDANFRNYLLEQDYGADAKLTPEEIESVTEMNVDVKNISSLKGIEYFTALTNLSCYRNLLTALDLSKNTALKILSCGYNQLTALDVSKNTALESLLCFNNQLTALDLSKNTALTSLLCYNNQLTALDLSKNTALRSLYCFNNQLTSINLSKNTVLTDLDCSYNKLTALDISKNTALKNLNCSYNQLTALDVSKNTALIELDCDGNQLTALDVSKNTALEYLYCYVNQLKGTQTEAFVNSLPTVTGGNLTFCDLTNSTEGNEITNTQVDKAKAKGWKVFAITDTGETEYAGIDTSIAINETNFPDANFRNYLLAQSYGADAKLTPEEIESITEIDVYGKDVSSLKGIEYFTALTSLDCDKNQLTTLDVSKNTALKKLDCSSNQLTTLDVSKNTALTQLDCGDNKLTALDLSKNTALEVVECYYNQLTALDVSKNTALRFLECNFNQLTSLDVSKNTALEGLFCSNNQLKGTQTEALVNSLPTVTRGNLRFYNLTDGTEGNEITDTQVDKAKAKGWTVLEWNGTEWVEYVGISTGISQLEQAQPKELRTYTLDGHPVEGRPAKPGIYIRGGKKVIVK